MDGPSAPERGVTKPASAEIVPPADTSPAPGEDVSEKVGVLKDKNLIQILDHNHNREHLFFYFLFSFCT